MKSNLTAVLFLLICLILSESVHGQRGATIIHGVVLDSITRQPLSNATIIIIGQPRSAITNNKGVFSIQGDIVSSFQLRADYVGYHSFQSEILKVSTGQITVDPIYLSLEKKPVHNVTVKASKPLIVQTINSTVLNVAESIVAVGSNAYDILLSAPGVFADQTGNIQVQGRGATVYIDGRLSNLGGQDLKNMLGNMGSAGIDKIEIITYPSARYDASGAIVINIRTNKNKNFGTNGTITGFAGAGRFFRGGAGFNLNNRTRYVNVYGSYDFQFNAQYFDNLSFRNSGFEETIRENEYDVRYRNNHSYKIGADIDVSKRATVGILVRGFINFRDRKVENNSTKEATGQPDSFSTVHTNGYARFSSPSLNLYFKTQLDSAGSELAVNADLFYYQKQWTDDFVTDYHTRPQTTFTPSSSLRDFSPANNTVRSLAIDYVRVLKKWRFETGMKGVLSRTDNDIVWQNNTGTWQTDLSKTNRFIYKENIVAGYVIISQKIRRFTFNTGLRLEHTFRSGESITLGQQTSSSFMNLFPNLGIQYSKSASSQLRLGYRKSIVRYGYDYVNPFIVYQSQYSYSQGNPSLQPQINHTVDLTWSFKNKLITTISYVHGIGALAPVYRQGASSQLISSYDNLASTDIAGLNISLTQSLMKWTSVNTFGVNYTKYTVGNIPRLGENLNLAASIFTNSYNTILLPQHLTAEIVISYRSRVASGIFKSGSYFITNLGVSRVLAKGDGNLKLAVSDLFNSQKIVNTVQHYQGVTGEFISKPESRFVTVAFSWRFGKKVVKPSRSRRSAIEEERGRMGGN